ncbi:IclR family transcriptional regulator [Paeniglutamicibacter kerguelensis]|uniref:DNA-binding IclR family transcriptional regulator n=1 Tax=Paeniglutamicibacter kerguelensis TaxID=254788 RepID=A0ABS4XAA1_9MICC|nr:IclR family transcriptional regulator [Paeniglutamicibacter kerguelensis]MBP2385394.1 DNA-binding IclR family transcriptional regulator [Paeniglutamicibacter kerguelensis]
MENKTSPVESVDRALVLMMAMRDGGPLSVKAAAELLGVAPSTAHRLLNSLAYRGFAAQSHDRTYRQGPEFSGRSAQPVSTEQIRQVAQAAMQQLQAAAGETVQLMVMYGGHIQFIDGVESKRTLRIGKLVGNLMPAFVSAGGKAMLARMTNTQLEDLYRSGLLSWSTSKITTPSLLKRHMTKVRRDGFGASIEETEQGVMGLGVSINDPHGVPVAALTIATPSVRFDRSAVNANVEALHRAAATVTEALYR